MAFDESVCLRDDVYGLGVDDSKFQRHIIGGIFESVGIPESRRIIRGDVDEDVLNLCDIIVEHYVEIPAVQSQQQSPSVENANKKKVHM